MEAQMMYRFAFSMVAIALASGCSGRDATGPMTSSVVAPISFSREGGDHRSGSLHATKECSKYTGQAGSFCTITSSSLKQIAVGSRVVYAKAAGATSLDSDLILYASGRGNNAAFGHVVLDFVTGRGVVTLSGGTGKFRGFHARVDVTPLVRPNWAWDGEYSFGGGEEKD
jgi:hypothetical protein